MSIIIVQKLAVVRWPDGSENQRYGEGLWKRRPLRKRLGWTAHRTVKAVGEIMLGGYGERHIIETDTYFSEVCLLLSSSSWPTTLPLFKPPGLRVPPQVFLVHRCRWFGPSLAGSVFAVYLLSGAITLCYAIHPYTITLSSFLVWLLLEAGTQGAHFLSSPSIERPTGARYTE